MLAVEDGDPIDHAADRAPHSEESLAFFHAIADSRSGGINLEHLPGAIIFGGEDVATVKNFGKHVLSHLNILPAPPAQALLQHAWMTSKNYHLPHAFSGSNV